MSTLVAPQIDRWSLPTGSWLPLAILPTAATALTTAWTAWGRMWAVAIAIYVGFKWLTFASAAAARHATWQRAVGYLLLWPGMDADAFFGHGRQALRPRVSEWVWAAIKCMGGLGAVFMLSPLVSGWPQAAAAWITLIGSALVLHFGLFHLLSLAWREAGVRAMPIMQKPLFATSLADFWGRRWNMAFRDAAHTFVFRPLAGRIGVRWAMMAVFFVSGLVHDVVISAAARAGLGLPTLYFLLQGGAVLVERSAWGRRMGLGRGMLGRLYAVALVVLPVGLLFHSAFLMDVVLPMQRAIASAAP
jgi:hypothetical protein